MKMLQRLPDPWVRERELAGDASHRRYARIWDGLGRSAVIVRYPQSVRDQLERDLSVRMWCEEHGLRVPLLLDHDLGHGWAVHEDFGVEDAEKTLEIARPDERVGLALRCLRPLVRLAELPPDELPRWNSPLHGKRLRWELAGFELWVMRHLMNANPSPAIGDWLDELAAIINQHPVRVCHRDFHLNNLFLLPEEEVGVIDYQDILIGPDTYDMASLLGERAMPRVLAAAERQRIQNAWATATRAEAGWLERFLLVRIQRGLKVLGTFARLTATGAASYEQWIEPLARDLAAEVGDANAPSDLVGLLLDLSRRHDGGDRGTDRE